MSSWNIIGGDSSIWGGSSGCRKCGKDYIAMPIEENARDLQSWKDKTMFIIIMFIKNYLIAYVVML
jgi:hypothetical protein